MIEKRSEKISRGSIKILSLNYFLILVLHEYIQLIKIIYVTIMQNYFAV